jgi:hypothetical protein
VLQQKFDNDNMMLRFFSPAPQFSFTYFGWNNRWESVLILLVLVLILRLHLDPVGGLVVAGGGSGVVGGLAAAAAGVGEVGPLRRTRLRKVVLFWKCQKKNVTGVQYR